MTDFWMLLAAFGIGFVLGSLGIAQSKRDKLEIERQKNADLRVKIAQLETGKILFRNAETN